MLKIILILSIHTLLVHSIPLSKIADPIIVNDVVFHKLGTFRGFTNGTSEFQKTYLFYKYSMSSWAEARSFCSSYGLEFLSMDTLEEALAVLTMADDNSVLQTHAQAWIYIDSITQTIKSPTDWYWTKTGKKISYSIPWRVGTPDNHLGSENCLSIGRYYANEKFGFDDAMCDSKTLIACQRIEFL
ncbi:hypothetical protein ACKWTF_008861 [Chironomus riparius]